MPQTFSNHFFMRATAPFFLLVILLTFGRTNVKAQAPVQCQDVMLQAFYWDSYTDSKWTNLNSKAGEIAANFSLVWLPPSGNCQSSSSMGYAPVYWFDQNSAFGTQAELKTLISSLKANGSKAIADVVVNHRSGVSNWTNFPSETYKGVTYSLGPAQICSTDEVKSASGQATPTGAPDTGDDFSGSRDLDHTSTVVRDAIKAYEQFLKNDMGYSGWRYDMTKGFSASYIKEYNEAAGGYFSVGECFDGYDRCNTWLDGCARASTTFDFACKFQLNSAMWNGGMNLVNLVWTYNGVPQPAGLIHHPDNKRCAVTFVDNHDTYRDNNKFNGNVLAAYAFLMGSPGVPCVFLKHWNDNKAAITAMIAARKAVKLHSQSAVTVNQSAANLYVATATGLNGTMIVKIGSGSYTAPGDYTLATSGTDYAIWTKTINDVAPALTVSPSGGTYYSAQSVTMSTSTGASIYYTTNNTTPTTASSLYSIPLTVSSSQTLRSIAYNPATQLYSSEATNTYTILALPSSIKIRFKVLAGWTACKAYCWVGSTPITAAWPGTAMTLDTDGYYSYTLSGFTSLPIGVVFNNGATSSTLQTVDLSASSDMCWDAGALSGSKYTATEVTCVTTGTDENVAGKWLVYPNPTHDFIQITVPDGTRQILVTNTTGQQLKMISAKKAGNYQVDLSRFPSGVYYISLSGGSGKTITKTVMKY